MATLTIKNMIFELADAPPIANTFANTYLNNRRFQRLQNRMRYWLNRQPTPPTKAEFQRELDRQVAEFQFDDEANDDALIAEAIDIASDLIRKKLTESGMPEPRGGLADHARQLVEADESFVILARQRLEAKAAAIAESIELLSMDAL